MKRASWLRLRLRLSLIAVAAAALVADGTVTPAEASPAQVARRTAEATLAQVRAAATEREEREHAHTEAPAPVAEKKVRPDSASTIRADDIGVSATFSGHELKSEVNVTVGAAPQDALVSARAEKPDDGVPVSDPVEINATTASGKPVTQFPAKRINKRGGGEKGPIVSDVVPGLSLALVPDLDRVEAAGIDTATLRIYTREGPGDGWVELPSYFDAKSGVVRGESTHLSQFVVIGKKFVPPPGPVVVLDPDNDEGHVTTPAPPVSELHYNIRLAQLVAGMMERDCLATVAITRQDPAVPFISRATRAGIAAQHQPIATVGIGFNTLNGVAWGGSDPTMGGSQSYSRGGPADDALSHSLVGNLPTYTTRPAHNMGNNGNFPGDEFAGVPGALTHLEALFLDNHFDRAVIEDSVGFAKTADGVFVGIGKWLETQGFDCSDPVTGGWPSPPSAADIARWRNLGLQSYQTYGGDPFSYSTGNLFEQEKLFTLTGTGGSSTDLTLFYNSQDGRLSRVGAGWSFGLGARAQRFDDGSVMVVRGDGASYVFVGNGLGGYAAEAAVHQTLVEQPGGRLLLRESSGESWLFDAGDIEGIGELVAHTDERGNATSLAYGAPNPDVQQFLPLTSITTPAGQVIGVDSDASGRVIGFNRPGGDRWSLAYDGSGNLTAITLPDGRTRSFTYDGSHRLLTAIDAAGAEYLKNEYDASGRVVKQWDAAGNLRRLDYSTAGQTRYTDTRGRTSLYFFDDRYRITKIQHADGTTASFSYDGQNNVTASTDENKRTTKYTYDASGNILTETSPAGSVVKYTYGPTGQVATRTDAGGSKGAARAWAFDYDATGRLIATHQPDGTIVSNRYDGSGNLVATTQPSGATTTYAYDSAGNVTAVTDPVGGVTRYAYDAAGRTTSVTDPAGAVTSYGWDSGDRVMTVTAPDGGVTTYGYEPNDHVSSVTDPTGATRRYTWDALFHLTQATTATGAVTKYSYDGEDSLLSETDPVGAVTRYATDERDRPVTVTDPNGGEWKREYDGVGRLTSVTSPIGAVTGYAYDADGNMIRESAADGGVTRYSYDSVGRLIKKADPDGVSTRYGYDLLDRVVRVTDGSGRRTDFGHDVDGNLVSVTNRSGDVTTFAYDAAGRMVSSTTALGETTAYGYSPAGEVTSVTDPLGRTTTVSYTATRLLAAVSDAAGNTTRYAYDGVGRRTAVTDANGHITAFGFDADGRQTSLTDATGATTTYGYDAAGRQTSAVSAEGRKTVYDYDPAGQLVAVIEGHRDGAAPGPDVNVTTAYDHDADGHVTAVTDPNGHTTRYTVDSIGRILSETNAVGTTASTTFTKAGRTATVTNGSGATIRYRYDKRGDLIRQDAAGAVATYEYGAEQNLIAVTDPGGVTGFEYDKNGRIVTQIDQQGGRLATAYDAAGQVAGVALPTGQKLSYTYDKAGKPTSQTSPWGVLSYAWDPAGNLTRQTRSTGVVSSYERDPANRVTRITHATPEPASPPQPTATQAPAPFVSADAQPAECATVAGYLGARAKSDLVAALCKPTAGYLGDRTLPTAQKAVADGGLLSYQYAYDADGNVSSATRSIASAPSILASTDVASSTVPAPVEVKKSSLDYAYDALNRLRSSTSSTGEKNSYVYDSAGNRTGWKRSGAADGNFSQEAVFSDANQLMRTTTTAAGRGVPSGVATYAYDAAGNRTIQHVADVSTSYSYNAAGQTTEVSRDGRNTTYGYDGLGRRTTSTDQTRFGTATTHTAFNGMQPLQTTSPQSGTTTLVRDVVGDLAAHVTATGEATWDLLDRLGSTVAGAVGASITQLSSYEDWGDQRFETGGWSAPENYTGETTDPTQGLNHYHARTYDPGAATWTSADPWRGLLTQPQSLHRYGYAWNNPSSNVDIDGNRCAHVNPASDALPTGCGAPPVMAYDNVTDKSKPPVAPQYPYEKSTSTGKNDKPKADDAKSKSDVTDRHGCKPGSVWQTNPYVTGECVSSEEIEKQRQFLNALSGVLGAISAGLGFAALFLGGIGTLIAGVASAVLGIASAVIGCIANGINVDCVVNAILALVPAGATAVTQALKPILRPIVAAAIDAAGAAIGGLGAWKGMGGRGQ